jgi:hypothetical protein
MTKEHVKFDEEKALVYVSKLSHKKQNILIELLKEVEKIQKSKLDRSEKAIKIKNILWTNRSGKEKLLIGGFLGTMVGFFVFGTGGIGIAALGGAVGIWGWFAGAAAGVMVSSLIQNLEQ